MKRRLPIALLLLFFQTFLFSQQREKITRSYTVLKDKYKDVFEVLKSDTSVKDGYYKSYRNNKLREEGFYSNGVKDSVWLEYMFGDNVLATKIYNHGKRTGKWEFADRHGNPEWSYDFNAQKADYIKPPFFADSAKFYYQAINGDWIKDTLDKNPIPLYGQGEYLVYMMHTLIYPQAAQDNNDQGTVVIGITVDENGVATDYTVYKSAAESLTQVAFDLVKGFYHEFLPAEKDGKKVKSRYLQPVTFRLETSR